MSPSKGILFLQSILNVQGAVQSTDDVVQWLEERNRSVKVHIEPTRFSALRNWKFQPATGNLIHESGKFFSIEGVHVHTDWGALPTWKQPVINQPEIGFLGALAKEIDGVLHFLMQAKIEPGNVNNVQLSPTLQATRSNYTQVHKGTKPLYLDYFLSCRPADVLLDQLQSEQGARFLRKRNRNIIVKTTDDPPVDENFRWLTLGQIIELMHRDNTVNMDARTVVSGIPFGDYSSAVVELSSSMSQGSINTDLLHSALDHESALHSIDDILSWLARLKSTYFLDVKPIGLNEIEDWSVTDEKIHHVEDRFFSILPVEVEIENREVATWAQPLLCPAQEGICAFVIKKINGLYHFLVQAKLECGNHDVFELAPTVQCLTGNYRSAASQKLPFLEYVLNAPKNRIIYEALQSEEGGRFYHEQNRNMIVTAPASFAEQPPDNYLWMSLNQLKTFLKFNNYLNIQARSLIAAIQFSTKAPA